MVYNVVEAGVALVAGIRAGSIALVGFGLDSVIEMAAAAVVLSWLRFEARGGDPQETATTESRVGRFVGFTFLALAIYVLAQSIWILWRAEPPRESLLGIVLASVSLLVMPLIALGKMKAARHIGSRALLAEAKETLACSYLSLCLFIGLVANAAWGWWWADPVAAILMVPWLLREGFEGLRG